MTSNYDYIQFARHQMPLRLQLFCGHFSTRGACQAMRIWRTPPRINCSKRVAGRHEDYTVRIIPRVALTITWRVSFGSFSQQLETVMMISDESRRFGDQYGQSFPQLGHRKGRFSLWEYLIRVLLLVGVLCLSTWPEQRS